MAKFIELINMIDDENISININNIVSYTAHNKYEGATTINTVDVLYVVGNSYIEVKRLIEEKLK